MSAGWRRNVGLLLARLQRTPSPAVMRTNLHLALRTLGPLSLPLLLLVALQSLCCWVLVARAVRVVVSFCGGGDWLRDRFLLPVGSTVLFTAVMLATTAAVVVVFFCTLLEASPPADLSPGGLARFLVPVYLAVVCPAAVSFVLDAPLLVTTALASLPPLLLSWPHLPEVLQLMVLFVRAKVNSRGRTRDMLDAIMGRIRPSRLAPLLAESVLQMGLLNFVTRQGIDALLLGQEQQPSLLLAWVAWPLLYLLVYACTRTFVASLSQLSGGICLVLLGVRYEWLRRTLESYPGPLLGRLYFVLRVLVAHCREHFAVTRLVCKHLPAATIFLFFRLTTLSPPFKCAASLVLAVFGFYQWMGLLRFPIVAEESLRREREIAQDQQLDDASAENSEPSQPLTEESSVPAAPSNSLPPGASAPSAEVEARQPTAEQEGSENTLRAGNIQSSAPRDSSGVDLAQPLETINDFSEEQPHGGDEVGPAGPGWTDGLRARRREYSSTTPFQNGATNPPLRRERGLMESVHSLIANSTNIPRSLNRVHEDPSTRLLTFNAGSPKLNNSTSAQSLLLAVHILLQTDVYRPSQLTELEMIQETIREDRLVHR